MLSSNFRFTGTDRASTSSYTFNAGTPGCNLDMANGYQFNDGYAYVFTEDYPFIMPGYYGTTLYDLCPISM